MPYYSNHQGYPIPKDGEEAPPDGFNGPLSFVGTDENWGDILQTLVRRLEHDTVMSGPIEDRPDTPDIDDGEDVLYVSTGEGADSSPTLYLYSDGTGWRAVAGGEFGEPDQQWAQRRVVVATNHGYPGDRTGGDITQLFRDNPNDVIILPEGDYNLDSTFNPTSGGPHESLTVIGEPEARIHVNVEDGIQFAELASTGSTWFKELRLENLTLVQNNSGDGTDTYDASWGRWWVADRIDNRNLTIEGQRDYHGVNSRYGDGSRAKFSYHANLTTETGVGIHRNIRIPDGDDPHTDITTEGLNHATAFSSEPGHLGTNYWIGCHASRHWDNGFYLKTTDVGSNIVIGCSAHNCGAGMFRLGRNDLMLANDTVFDLDQSTGDYPTSGVGIDTDKAEGTAVIGHYAQHDTSSSEAIRIRSNSRGITIRDVHVENNTNQYSLTVSYGDDDTDPTHFATDADRAAPVTIENCYIHDHGDSSVRGAAVELARPNSKLVNTTVRTTNASFRCPVKVLKDDALITGCNLDNAAGGNDYAVELGRANTSASQPGQTVTNVTISDTKMNGGLILRDPDTANPNTFESVAWYACDLRDVPTGGIFFNDIDPHVHIAEFAFFGNLGYLTDTQYGELSSRNFRAGTFFQSGNVVLDSGDESGLSVENSQQWQGYEIYVQNTVPTTSNPYIRFEDS